MKAAQINGALQSQTHDTQFWRFNMDSSTTIDSSSKFVYCAQHRCASLKAGRNEERLEPRVLRRSCSSHAVPCAWHSWHSEKTRKPNSCLKIKVHCRSNPFISCQNHPKSTISGWIGGSLIWRHAYEWLSNMLEAVLPCCLLPGYKAMLPVRRCCGDSSFSTIKIDGTTP